MCGIVGIVSDSSVNQQVYDALALLQHRGQDSTGIATPLDEHARADLPGGPAASICLPVSSASSCSWGR